RDGRLPWRRLQRACPRGGLANARIVGRDASPRGAPSSRPCKTAYGRFCPCGALALTSRADERSSGVDADAAPERDVILDLVRRFLGLGVVPGGVLVGLALHHHVEVARGPFPWAGRVRRAVVKVVARDRVGREVVVPLDDLAPVALGEDGAV